MLLDYEKKECDCFALWSGDSDFAGPVGQLLKDGKKVYIFSTARKVPRELSELVPDGLYIYDIEKRGSYSRLLVTVCRNGCLLKRGATKMVRLLRRKAGRTR